MNHLGRFIAALLYTSLFAGAIPAIAPAADGDALAALRTGDMRKLVIADAPRATAGIEDVVLLDSDGRELRLPEIAGGRVVLLNFWATWCAPCRHEMPSLDALEAALGGDSFAVIPVATGRNPVDAIDRFYSEASIGRLPVVRDPRQELARGFGVLGLPTSVILDGSGREVARLTGDADWQSEDALTIMQAITGGGGGG